MVGCIQLINVTDASNSVTNTLLKGLSYITHHINCNNELYENYMKKTIISSTIISIKAYDEKMYEQNEIEHIIDLYEIWESCENKKKSIIILGEYLTVELNSMPAGKLFIINTLNIVIINYEKYTYF